MLILLALSLVGQPESAGQLFERAYFVEQAEGDLEAAIDLYEQVVDDFPEERGLAARALLRMGLCHERLGYEAAEQAYRRLLRQYADQEEPARIARERLDALRAAREAPRSQLPTGATLREIVLAGGEDVGDGSASVSPDGKYLAYVDGELGRFVVQDLVLQRPSQTVALAEGGPTINYRWSRDGRYVAYDEGIGDDRVVQVLDVETGRARELLRRKEFTFPIDWSPDGHRLLLQSGRNLLLAGREGEELLEVPLEGQNIRWSPSGAWVAFDAGEFGAREVYVAKLPEPGETSLGTGRIDAASASNVSRHPGDDVNPVWSPDGRYLVFRSDRAKSWDLWVLELEDGRLMAAPRLLERDIGETASLQDWLVDRRLVFTKRRGLGDVWVQPIDPVTLELPPSAYLIPTRIRGRQGQARWSPDGKRLSFRTQRRTPGGSLHVLTPDGDGSDELAIEILGGFQNADWNPDGKRLVFCKFGGDGVYLGEHDLESGDSRTLSSSPLATRNVFAPDVSPDGRSVLFNRADGATSRHFLYDLATREVSEIPNSEGTWRGRWSPDGKWLALAGDALCVLHPDGSDKRCLVELDKPEFLNAWVSWSPDGRHIAYPRGRSHGNNVDWDVWVVSLDGREHRNLELPEHLNPWWVDWSPDGKNLALATANGNTAVWVLENFFRPETSEP